jgi:hypothetical protein
VTLNTIVPWSIFREPLEAERGPRDPKKGDRPFYDAVLMFKILVLRELYALSDEQVESQIASQTGLSSEQLYRSFSEAGNPTLKTTLSVMKALGIDLTAKLHAAA